MRMYAREWRMRVLGTVDMINDGGYIKLYRKIWNHWIWENPQHLKQWIDLMLLANHKPTNILMNNKLVEIKRGEFHTSLLKLSERWGIDRRTVDSFLKILEKEGMILVKKTRQHGTTIIVKNYEDFQGLLSMDDESNVHQNVHRNVHRTVHRNVHRIVHKQEDKKDKNNNKDKNILSGSSAEKPRPPSPTLYNQVMDHLNKVCGTAFKASAKHTQKHISARLNEGYNLDDFIAVIDKKHREWRDNPEMAQYLRPQTLFGTKFESYLNQPATDGRASKPVQKNKFTSIEGHNRDYAEIERLEFERQLQKMEGGVVNNG